MKLFGRFQNNITETGIMLQGCIGYVLIYRELQSEIAYKVHYTGWSKNGTAYFR